MADRPTINEEAELGPEWQEVSRLPIIPGQQTGAPPSPNQMSPYFSGSISPTLQHDATFVGTRYGTPSIASYPLVPPGPSGIPTVNSAVQSTVASIPVTPATTFTGWVFKGTWSSTTAYAINNVVIFNKSTYLALLSSVDVQPDGDDDPAKWQLISENLFFNPSLTPSTQGVLAVDGSFVGTTANTNIVSPGTLTSSTATDVLFWVNAQGLATTPAGYTIMPNVPNPGGDGAEPWFYHQVSSTGAITPSTVQPSGNTNHWASIAVLFSYNGIISTATSTTASLTSNVVTINATNTFTVGEKVSFSGFTNFTFLNGTIATLLTATSSSFTFAFLHANESVVSDAGIITSLPVVQQSSSAGFPTSPAVTGTVTFINPITKGNLILFELADIVTSASTLSVVSVTDNLGNAYTLGQKFTPAGPGFNGAMVAMAYLFAPAAGITSLIFTLNRAVITADVFAAKAYEILASTIEAYLPYDVVEFNGSMYVCLYETTSPPSVAPLAWGLLGMVNPMVNVGDTIYEGANGPVALLGNTSTTLEFLTQTGTGSASAAPVWEPIPTSALPPIWNAITKAANYNASPKDFVLAVTTGGAFDIVLPYSASCADQMIGVKKISNDSTVLTIAAMGSDLIDGASTQTISIQWNSMTFLSSGTGWYLI